MYSQYDKGDNETDTGYKIYGPVTFRTFVKALERLLSRSINV